ncbi:hypothetical protein KL942_004952 [Ogataea angusta]|uniref:GPI ethanolamine phosphate transferase 2 n=1 Tax=Pichia angusta TaxID=870730 RepID=A0ABQ7RQX8_PICAN|nr:hypothetical protein KL942_004952 [Ogataea angusta]KAG7845977.1 hypothetical protein KL940_004816 [Ogataea angusta]
MVIDALRADFLFSNESQMTFVHELINNGYALGYTAYSNPPTVTLPRLKGITTGSTPNFIDAVLNIAEEDTSSTLGDQDSWVKQMHASGWKINMFGDDTWLKLFPSYFAKTDGTASFYVSDFTIVDNNVTRHLDYELSKEGQKHWDCLILHYLGLDHIGHKGGPASASMPAKQREMDSIIRRIFESAVKKDDNTVFVVMGDHGMNEVGNHGGSSIGEVSAGLLLVSSKFRNLQSAQKAPIPRNADFDYFDHIDQIDLVPTLSTLLGLKIPINNLGTFMHNLLPLYTAKDKLNVLIKNALQLKVLTDKSRNKVTSLDSEIDVSSVSALLDFLHDSKRELSKTSSDYNYTDIFYGLAGYAFTALLSLVLFFTYHRGCLLEACVDLLFFILYAVNFFGSSMIEEEHHLWWFFTTLFVATITVKSKSFYSTTLLICLRLLKAWNNSGQKNNIKSNMKIATYVASLSSDIGPVVVAFLIASTLATYCFYVTEGATVKGNGDGTIMRFVTFVSTSLLCFITFSTKFLSYLSETYDLKSGFKEIPDWCSSYIQWIGQRLGTTDINTINQQLFSLFNKVWLVTLAFHLLKPLLFKISKLPDPAHNYTRLILTTFTQLLISQTNFNNVPIFFLLLVILLSFQKLVPPSSSNAISLFTILMQNLSFFQFGFTNSLSSVDLTNSFNGLSSYNMIISGLLTFVCNWAAPIFWSLAYLHLTLIPDGRNWERLYHRLLVTLTFYSVSGLVLILSCYSLRFHLFIWTVFSPKILYFLSWMACGLLVDFGLSCIVTALYIK